jgi:pre-mRNA-splicing helicase BRR2
MNSALTSTFQPWYRYFDLVGSFIIKYLAALILLQTPPEIGELLGIPNAGRLVHRLVHNFPKLQ